MGRWREEVSKDWDRRHLISYVSKALNVHRLGDPNPGALDSNTSTEFAPMDLSNSSTSHKDPSKELDKLPSPTRPQAVEAQRQCASNKAPAPLHYGLTGGWVQKFKASYLAYFLQCALTDYVSGKA